MQRYRTVIHRECAATESPTELPHGLSQVVMAGVAVLISPEEIQQLVHGGAAVRGASEEHEEG